MFRWALRVVALVAFAAANCSAPQRTDHWMVERHMPDEEVASPTHTVCDDITDLTLGRFAGDSDIGPILDELSRIAPLVGASAALPHLTDAHAAAEAGDSPALPLGQAASAIDAASFTECEIPVFTVLSLSTSFSSCHGRVALPVAGLAPATTGCDLTSSALFVPCFDSAAGYAPVDCLTGDAVRLVDADWVGAQRVRSIASTSKELFELLTGLGDQPRCFPRAFDSGDHHGLVPVVSIGTRACAPRPEVRRLHHDGRRADRPCELDHCCSNPNHDGTRGCRCGIEVIAQIKVRQVAE